ncbi:flagellar hook-associated protein FlgL [Bacillus sp. FJAT-27251]|uniref:flagellar hook-associated protein FlgL n=1 Tax=Bacillus sp. FJAT-27251 TaxID=1684142 RepID=UPI0006A781C5|nr:flagellar hook-associated protein FlgL [Bacillus sp. FJAT-27251]
MRITQQMLHQSSVRHMNQNLSRFEKIGQQVSTGKLLASPSDDPVRTGKSMNLKSAIAANQQYTRNIDTASMWLEETDHVMNQTVNILHRVRELAVQGGNDALSGQDRATIAAEVEQLAGQIREFLNTKVNGKYVFNGQKTNQPPYPEADSYKTNSFDTGAVAFSVADGVIIKANVTADVLFGRAEDESNLFQSLEEIAEALREGGAIPLGKLDKGMDRILTAWAETGAVKGRMEAVENRLKDSDYQLRLMLSKVEDVDLAEAITKLKSEEAVYQASLAVTSKMIQSTLVDYLR